MGQASGRARLGLLKITTTTPMSSNTRKGIFFAAVVNVVCPQYVAGLFMVLRWPVLPSGCERQSIGSTMTSPPTAPTCCPPVAAINQCVSWGLVATATNPIRDCTCVLSSRRGNNTMSTLLFEVADAAAPDMTCHRVRTTWPPLFVSPYSHEIVGSQCLYLLY